MQKWAKKEPLFLIVWGTFFRIYLEMLLALSIYFINASYTPHRADLLISAIFGQKKSYFGEMLILSVITISGYVNIRRVKI